MKQFLLYLQEIKKNALDILEDLAAGSAAALRH